MAKRTPVDLKQFRHAVSVLKKKGLISNIDARKAEPHWIRQGNRLLDTVRKYDDIVSGKVEPAFLPPEKIKEYQKAGYSTIKLRSGKRAVLVPKSATEKVTVTSKGEIKVEHPSGLTRIKQAVPFQNIPQWLRDMKAAAPRIDAIKKDNEWFFYKFFGYNSYSVYTDIDLLLDDLENGSASGLNLMDKARESTRKQQNEIYQNLEIATWPKNRPYPEPVRKRGTTSKASRKRWRKRVAGTLVGKNLRARDAETHKQWRAQLTGRALKEYKNEAKKRSKKSRDRRKAAKKSANKTKRKK